MNQSAALSILKSGKNVFLTGSAGAGKTYVLNQYIEYLKERKIPVAVTASTGIAATHMNGLTIHSWSGIGVNDTLGPEDLQKMKVKKYLKDQIEETKVLIIDEVSMLHRQQLDMVELVLRYFKKNDLPFGGIQVVFSGDFFQLPPIGKSGEDNRDKFAFMSSAWLSAAPVICYLTEQHRQSDNELNQILNKIREGQAGQDVSDQLTRITLRQKPPQLVIPRLYTHNMDVDRINTEHLMGLRTTSKVYAATVKGNDKLRDLLRKSVLTDEILELKIGTKVMFIKNNFDKGYMNGTLGEIIEFSDNDFPMVKVSSGAMIEAEPEDWTIQDERGKTLASFNQVPLRLAWAITVHKSQGMTLDAAEIDLSKTFENGQGYVALSRLRDLEGLYLTGFNYRALQVDALALKADKRFQELSSEAELKWTVAELEEQASLFVLSSGGLKDDEEIRKHKRDKKAKAEKKSTFDITAELLQQGLSIASIARDRDMAESSILTHLPKIKLLRPDISIEHLRPDEFIMADVRAAIQELGSDAYTDNGSFKLGALFSHLNQKLDYSTLKLALLFVE